jgi:predicted RNA-binding protein with RPS1 domain
MHSKNARGCASNDEKGFDSALNVLERYQKDGDEFLSHIVCVTGDEIWVSILDVEPKNSQNIHIRQSSRKPFKQHRKEWDADIRYSASL